MAAAAAPRGVRGDVGADDDDDDDDDALRVAAIASERSLEGTGWYATPLIFRFLWHDSRQQISESPLLSWPHSVAVHNHALEPPRRPGSRARMAPQRADAR